MKLVQISDRRGIDALVVDDDQLVPTVPRPCANALEARFQQRKIVTRRHDQGHERRRIRQWIARAVQCGRRAGLDEDFHRTPVEMILQRLAGSDVRIGFLCWRTRRRAPDGAPVIEHRGHVPDLPCLDHFRNAQGEVIVLASFHSVAESAELLHNRAPVRAQVAHEVVRMEQVGVPIGLEVRIEAPSLLVDLVLVAVDDCGVGMSVQLLGQPEERVRR